MKRFLIMAGGTGGHVFPALAIVKQLQAQGHVVEWLGTRGRIEEHLIPEHNIPIHFIDVQGVRRNGLGALLKSPFQIAHAILQARAVIKKFQPDVVIGFGGYASGPGGMAAKLCGVPLVLHEQNAAAGMTNRILARFANKILLGVGQAFTGPKVESVGNPIRAEIASLASETRSFEHEGNVFNILIVGGSLGAAALNSELPKILCSVAPKLERPISVFHQCGKGNANKTRELYKDASFEVTTSDFVTDMASAYRKADLIICRAGASTISEISAAKLPSILVPLPTAVDNHQFKNALSLKDHGAALIAEQKPILIDNPAALEEMIISCLDKSQLMRMSHGAAECAKLDATERVCAIVEALAK